MLIAAMKLKDAYSLLGKIEGGWKEKTVSEDEMAGWYHQCNGHKLGQTLGDGEG